MPQLVYEFQYNIATQPNDYGIGPTGQRIWFHGLSGTFSGERLNGTIAGSGNWVLCGPDGYGRLDARVEMHTHDGARIYAQYFGLIELTDSVLAWAAGEDVQTDYGDHYFFSTPRFETSHPAYEWLNRTVFIGQGHGYPPSTVEYQVFRVAH